MSSSLYPDKNLIHSLGQCLSSSLLYPEKISSYSPTLIMSVIFSLSWQNSHSFTLTMPVIFSLSWQNFILFIHPDNVCHLFPFISWQNLILFIHRANVCHLFFFSGTVSFIHRDNVCHLFLFIGTKSHSFTVTMCHLFPFNGTKSHLFIVTLSVIFSPLYPDKVSFDVVFEWVMLQAKHLYTNGNSTSACQISCFFQQLMLIYKTKE